MTSKSKITEETTVTTTELASILGLTARRIQQMAQDGTITAESRGRFRLSTAAQQYMDFIKEKQKMELTEEDLKVERKIREAEAKMKQAKAVRAGLESDELTGKVHREEDVTAVMDEMVYEIRDALQALPGRLAVDIANAGTPEEAEDVIRKEIGKILKILKRHLYDPEKFREKVRDRMNWQGGGEPEEVE